MLMKLWLSQSNPDPTHWAKRAKRDPRPNLGYHQGLPIDSQKKKKKQGLPMHSVEGTLTRGGHHHSHNLLISGEIQNKKEQHNEKYQNK